MTKRILTRDFASLANPQGRPNATPAFLFFVFLFLHHETRMEGREKGNSEGQGREGGGGWRTGDEWEWWFYWVLSGWVDAE